MAKTTLLIDPRCAALGLTVQPPPDTTIAHWKATHLWMTVDGNWDDVPSWAKQYQDDRLGGATHLFMYGTTLEGKPATEQNLFLLGWPGGFHKFHPLEVEAWWGNAVIGPSGFNWKEGPGPYYAQANALSSSIVQGIGLPYPPLPWQPQGGAIGAGGVHVSYFVRMQEVAAYEPEPQPEPEPEPEPGVRCRDHLKAWLRCVLRL